MDLTIHALTKYPSGGGDILMGSVVTRDEKLHHRLFRMHAILGISVSGDDTAQIQRSLAHMSLRYEQQSNNAKTLLTWLKEQPQFAQVLHQVIKLHLVINTGKKFAQQVKVQA